MQPQPHEMMDNGIRVDTASLLPLHVIAARIVYHYEQQEQQCYICDETGHFSQDCPVCLKALKDKKDLNSKGAPNMGGQKPPKLSKRAMEGTPPRKRCAALCIRPENLMPVLNEDARSCWLGRDNVGYAMIEGK